MKKKLIIIIAIFVVIAVVAGILLMNSKPKTNLEPVRSAEDLIALADKIYEGQDNILFSLDTRVVDMKDVDSVKSVTGLENVDELEYVVASEPMIMSQAYSLVLVKVKSGVNSDEIAKTMSENVDQRKWICVTAEKLYATSSGDIVCLVMSREELAKPIYEKFKTLAGNINDEYEKTEVEPELPEIPEVMQY